MIPNTQTPTATESMAARRDIILATFMDEALTMAEALALFDELSGLNRALDDEDDITDALREQKTQEARHGHDLHR